MEKDLKSLVILFKAYQSVINQVKVSLEDTNLNVNEFAAMEALYHKGCLTTQELIDHVLIANSSMTYVLDILSRKKLISRNKDPKDRRIQKLSLTDAGKELFSEVYDKHYKHMRSFFDVLTTEDEVQLQGYLKQIGKSAASQG